MAWELAKRELAALITIRRWKWRRRWRVMEVKESEGSYVTPLILDQQYLKISTPKSELG
jgi:hypothetical protein